MTAMGLWISPHGDRQRALGLSGNRLTVRLELKIGELRETFPCRRFLEDSESGSGKLAQQQI
jgi:hypothetical protein